MGKLKFGMQGGGFGIVGREGKVISRSGKSVDARNRVVAVAYEPKKMAARVRVVFASVAPIGNQSSWVDISVIILFMHSNQGELFRSPHACYFLQ